MDINNIKVDSGDAGNYSVMVNARSENRELRVDSKGKFYSLSKSDALLVRLKNFFIKLFSEGWGCDATLKNRLVEPVRSAFLKGSLPARVSAVVELLATCNGIPRNREHYNHLLRLAGPDGSPVSIGTLREEFQEENLQKAREQIGRMRQQVQDLRGLYPGDGVALDEIEDALKKLETVELLIRIHPDFPNQLKRDIDRIFKQVFGQGEQASVEAALQEMIGWMQKKLVDSAQWVASDLMRYYGREEFERALNEVARDATAAVKDLLPPLSERYGIDVERAEQGFVKIASAAQLLQDKVAYPRPAPEDLIDLLSAQ